jgi:dihydropteroate synthase
MARLGASLGAALAALERGAQLLRVHDLTETRQAVDMWRALHENC